MLTILLLLVLVVFYMIWLVFALGELHTTRRLRREIGAIGTTDKEG